MERGYCYINEEKFKQCRVTEYIVQEIKSYVGRLPAEQQFCICADEPR